MTAQTPEEIKACCAAAYGSDVVALLLGDSYHPGGLALTRRLARQLDLPRGAHVLDVAAGRGATGRLLAGEFGLRVSGVDLSAANVALAQGSVATSGLNERVSFHIADAEALPHSDASFDAVVVECALCTFPDKPTAVSEIARVLRRGGRLGLTDVVADPDRLPPGLSSLAARVACIADALPMHSYESLVESVGLRIARTERHDTSILRMIDQIEARLTLLRLAAPAEVAALGLDLQRTRAATEAARAAVAEGILGYGLLVAQKT